MTEKLLFLAPINPMGIGGGSFATHAYLRAFSELWGGKVDVLLADSWKDKWDEQIKVDKKYTAKPMTKLQYALSPFTHEIQRYSRVAEEILQEHHEDYSCVVSNGSSISGKLYKTTQKYGLKLVTIHHNCEPEFFAANTKGLHRTVYLPIVKQLERKAYQESNLNLFLTGQDMSRFCELYREPKGGCHVIGVFEFKDFNKPHIIEKEKVNMVTFVITGSLCTMQGEDGIVYFFENLYQYLPKNSKLIIAGRDPTPQIKELCSRHANVELIASPDRMRDVISRGDVYICPTRVGGGLKLRIMDGLKLGLPVITHECSARGYDDFYGTPYFKSFVDKEGFKFAVETVVGSLKCIRKQDIVDKYRETFSYEAGQKRMEKIFL